MNRDLRCVLDTNVLVSALLFHDSIPGSAVARIRDEATIVLSSALVEEINEVLGRKKFDRYVTRDERERFVAALILESELVEIQELVQGCRDPEDNHLLELAVNGQANVVVTGDRDLLEMNPFRGILIMTPEEFLSRYE